MLNDLKRVAIYARVSSERQDVDLSISAQLKALREYATRQGLLVVKEYIDEAESGRSIDRPGFKAMVAASRQRPLPFEAILVWKLSRFARNREDSIIYKSLLRKQGVQVVSINEPLEDTPSGRLLEGIIEVIDEFYSANLSQDVARGMRESASRGFYPGGPVPWGYKRVQVADGSATRSKLEIDTDKAPLVERMFRECIGGKGLKEIAKGLNNDGVRTRAGRPWSTTGLHSVLRNEAYTGVLAWDKTKSRRGRESSELIRVEGAWAAIIDKQTFDKAQVKMANRAPRVTHPRVVHSDYLLSGMLRCSFCGAAMVGHAVKSGKFFYYMCGNARRSGRAACSHAHLFPKEKIEMQMLDRIKFHILTVENVEDLVKLTNEELAQNCGEQRERLTLLESAISEVEGRLSKLYDALETGKFSGGELAPRIQELFAKKEELQRARIEAEQSLRVHAIELSDRQVLGEYVRDMKTLLEESSLMKRKAFLRTFVKRIDVTESEAKVTYTFPMLGDAGDSETVPVLPFMHNSPPLRTVDRTSVASCEAPSEGNRHRVGHLRFLPVDPYFFHEASDEGLLFRKGTLGNQVSQVSDIVGDVFRSSIVEHVRTRRPARGRGKPKS